MKNLILLLAILSVFSEVAFADFSDVEEDYSYVNAVNWLQENGVVKGYDDGTYKPDQFVNRAEFVKMLYVTLGQDGIYGNKPIEVFNDLEDGKWYGGYVIKAYMDGYVEGYKDGTFKPNNPITTAEAFKIVMTAFFLKNHDLGDFVKLGTKLNCLNYDIGSKKSVTLGIIDENAWFASYVHKAHNFCLIPKEMLLNSDSNEIFDPNHQLSRGEMAEFLYRGKAVLDSYKYTKYPDGMYSKSMGAYGNSDVLEPKPIFKTK